MLPHPLTGVGRVRLESVPNAVAQAGVAAATLLGRDDPTPAACRGSGPTRATSGCRSPACPPATTSTSCAATPTPSSSRSCTTAQGELLAVDAVNTPADYLVVRKALTRARSIPADAAADAVVPLKPLLAEAAAV